MKMVDSRRICILVVDLQMKGYVVVDEQGSDMMNGWMNGVMIVLLGIVEVNAVVVVVVEVVVDGVVQVVESAGVEVLEVAAAAAVAEVVVDEPLEVDTVEEEH